MFLDWLGSLLKPLGEWFSHATGGSGSQVAFVLGAFVIAAVVVGLAYAIVRILDAWSDPRARVRTPRDARAGDLASARPSGEWRALAEAAAARGEYAFAIAALFSAALAYAGRISPAGAARGRRCGAAVRRVVGDVSPGRVRRGSRGR